MITNGKLTYKGVGHVLDLENMKFGLTGYMKDSLDVKKDTNSEGSTLLFAGPGCPFSFIIMLDGEEPDVFAGL